MKKTAPILAIITAIVAIAIGLALALKKPTSHETKLSIIATNFPAYDFARAITKDVEGVSLKLLIKPGTETHDFEPSPQDVVDIKSSDLLIYTSNDAEQWTERLIKETRDSFAMRSVISDTDEDDHVWTNLENAQAIISALAQRIIAKDEDNREQYEKNGQHYIGQIRTVASDIREIVKNAKRQTIIFGDRFPIERFAKEFDLSYQVAYDSCEEHSEVSAKRVAELIDYVKTQKIPVVFRMELSDGKIAEEISRATGATVREFHSAHNLSQSDFDAGKSYLDYIRQNAEVLKEALN